MLPTVEVETSNRHLSTFFPFQVFFILFTLYNPIQQTHLFAASLAQHKPKCVIITDVESGRQRENSQRPAENPSASALLKLFENAHNNFASSLLFAALPSLHTIDKRLEEAKAAGVIYGVSVDAK